MRVLLPLLATVFLHSLASTAQQPEWPSVLSAPPHVHHPPRIASAVTALPRAHLLPHGASVADASRPASRAASQLAPAASDELSAASPKLVFAHMMLCFAAFGPLGNSSAAVAGYEREIAVAAAAGLDGLAVEFLGHDAYYQPAIQGMYAACAAHNARVGGSFRLFPIINFCCGLGLADAVALYTAWHAHPCAQQLGGRPVFSAWSAVNWTAGGAAEAARWEADFFAPIAAAGLPRPYFLPFVYAYDEVTHTYEETATLAQQQQTLREFGSALDGLWYWGCAPPGNAVAASSAATVAACRAAGKLAAVPVSAPYSPHIGDRGSPGAGNNRYTQSNGAKALIDVWSAHIQAQPDVVIYTTWNDEGEHHLMGP